MSCWLFLLIFKKSCFSDVFCLERWPSRNFTPVITQDAHSGKSSIHYFNSPSGADYSLKFAVKALDSVVPVFIWADLKQESTDHPV